MTRASPAACRNPAQPGSRARPPAAPLAARQNPEPSPLTAATQAGRPARRGNASRNAAPPNSTGFSATWCTMSGRSRRYSAAIAAMARPAPTTRSPRRRQLSASSRNPSPRILSPCTRSRAATTTSNPASRAARAIGSRCDQKYQSSVTRKISFGRLRPSRGGRSIRGLSIGEFVNCEHAIIRRHPSAVPRDCRSGRCRSGRSRLIHPRPRRSRKQQNGAVCWRGSRLSTRSGSPRMLFQASRTAFTIASVAQIVAEAALVRRESRGNFPRL